MKVAELEYPMQIGAVLTENVTSVGFRPGFCRCAFTKVIIRMSQAMRLGKFYAKSTPAACPDYAASRSIRG